MVQYLVLEHVTNRYKDVWHPNLANLAETKTVDCFH